MNCTKYTQGLWELASVGGCIDGINRGEEGPNNLSEDTSQRGRGRPEARSVIFRF